MSANTKEITWCVGFNLLILGVFTFMGCVATQPTTQTTTQPLQPLQPTNSITFTVKQVLAPTPAGVAPQTITVMVPLTVVTNKPRLPLTNSIAIYVPANGSNKTNQEFLTLQKSYNLKVWVDMTNFLMLSGYYTNINLINFTTNVFLRTVIINNTTNP